MIEVRRLRSWYLGSSDLEAPSRWQRFRLRAGLALGPLAAVIGGAVLAAGSVLARTTLAMALMLAGALVVLPLAAARTPISLALTGGILASGGIALAPAAASTWPRLAGVGLVIPAGLALTGAGIKLTRRPPGFSSHGSADVDVDDDAFHPG
jgi:hypothetical protein